MKKILLSCCRRLEKISDGDEMKEKHIKEGIALSRVYGEGEKIIGISLEFDEEIIKSKLDKNAFMISGRTIDKILVYQEFSYPDMPEKETGKYIVLKLNEQETEALTVYEMPRNNDRPGGITNIRETHYEVKQLQEITTVQGKRYPAGESIAIIKKKQPVVEHFRTYKFQLQNSDKEVVYNLYEPENINENEKYPLVLFIEDAGVLSENPLVTLCQGLGATIFASAKEQKKHPAFVLAPQFPGPDSLVEDDFSCTWEVAAAMELLKDIIKNYPIDVNRVYGTGQSMGCMTLCELSVRYPNVFGGCLLVGGQWNPAIMDKAKEHNFWIVVSEGDKKAFPGMNMVAEVFENNGVPVGRAVLDAKADFDELNRTICDLQKDGNHIHYTWFAGDSVIPEGVTPTPLLHHRNTWRVTYQLEALRDWLFGQLKRIEQIKEQ